MSAVTCQNHRKDNPAQARVQSHGVGYAADAQDRRLDANAQGGVYRFGELSQSLDILVTREPLPT